MINRVWCRIDRRAKYIRILLDNGQVLLIHLRMTGRLRLRIGGEPADILPHDRLIFSFADGRALHFHDTRAFGRVRLIDGPTAPPLDRLGPEPLTPAFTSARFAQALRTHRRMLKPLLLDQTFLAGMGNIYVDEALWSARLHPMRTAAGLAPHEVRRLHRAIRSVLGRAVVLGGTTLGSGSTNFYSVAGRRGDNLHRLRVFRRQDEPCPRCGTLLKRARLAQRGTHWCPSCQPLP